MTHHESNFKNEAMLEVETSVQVEQPKIQAKKGVTQDWRQLFKREKYLGALQFFEPTRVNGKVVVKLVVEVIEEGIAKCVLSLVG